MKIGKLVLIEIVAVIIILIFVIVIVEGIPTFASSSQSDTVSMYQEKEYSRGSVVMANGETARTRFNYTTYDPAILIVKLTFHQWQTPGNITVYCNGRAFGYFIATPDRPEIQLSALSVSGADWVQPSSAAWPTIGSFFAYGNEISFVSTLQNGFAGTFDYVVSIRGSR